MCTDVSVETASLFLRVGTVLTLNIKTERPADVSVLSASLFLRVGTVFTLNINTERPADVSVELPHFS